MPEDDSQLTNSSQPESNDSGFLDRDLFGGQEEVILENSDSAEQGATIPSKPYTTTQKIIFAVFAAILFVGLGFASRRLVSNTEIQDTVPPLFNKEEGTRFTSNEFGISFLIPHGWEVAIPSSGSPFLALKPENQTEPCFPDISRCKFIFENKENLRNIRPEDFGPPFYPQMGDLRGAVDRSYLSGFETLILYNVRGTGGRILYIIQPRSIIRLELRGEGGVTREEENIFDQIFSSIIFLGDL